MPGASEAIFSTPSEGRRTRVSVRSPARRRGEVDRSLDQALGWFSVGLGLTEILAPRRVGKLIGVGEHPVAMRLCGLREIASGMGLLSGRVAAVSATSRVVGDAMDLALLGAALRSSGARPGRLMLAAAAVLGVTAADVYASGQHTRAALVNANQEVPISVSMTVNSPAEKVYAFWRNFENLPRFMRHLESVTPKDERTSHWVARAPGGLSVAWDAELIDDQAGSLLVWRTLPDSEVRHHGSVRFEPAGKGRGTIVHVQMEYSVPGGMRGAKIAKLLGEDPKAHIKRDLRALKQLIESGELATTRGQSAGARSLLGKALTRREP